MFRSIKKFLRRLKSLLAWISYFWKDENFDSGYILKLLKRKIELTRHTFEESQFRLHPDKTIKNMLIVEELLKRIVEDSYAEYEMNEHTKKWGKFKVIEESESGFSSLRREGVKSVSDHGRERKEALLIYKKMEERKSQDMDLLFKILRRHILYWWD